MRRATAWFVVVGVAALVFAGPARAAEGFWVSIATGAAGSSTATGYQEWWFETPHGPAPVTVTQLTGPSVEATTGGGSSFFNGGAVPVVLHTTDGYGYLAGGTKPADLGDALKRQTAGGRGLATAPPDATATTPPAGANLLSVDQSDPDATGARTVTLSLTDPNLAPLAGGSATMPDGGWWVIGLGPNENVTDPGPDPGPGPIGGGGGGDPDPPPGPGPDPGPTPGPGPVATPEPATGLLAGLGGLGVLGLRRLKRRQS